LINVRFDSFFPGSVLSPSWIQVSFILIEGILSPSWIQVFFILIERVCLRVGVLWSITNSLGVAFNVFQENPMNL